MRNAGLRQEAVNFENRLRLPCILGLQGMLRPVDVDNRFLHGLKALLSLLLNCLNRRASPMLCRLKEVADTSIVCFGHRVVETCKQGLGGCAERCAADLHRA